MPCISPELTSVRKVFFVGRIFGWQGLVEAEIDNGIPCLGASNLGAQTK